MNPGRNDPCPCGSGKKYKKCCLLNEQRIQGEKNEPSAQNEPEESLDERDFWTQALFAMRKLTLHHKPHIKAYLKIRKLHSEILDAMIQYHDNGRFQYKVDEDYRHPQCGRDTQNDTLQLIQSVFDCETCVDTHASLDVLVYKPAPDMNCITEEFIQKHRYRREDKVALLHSMLASTLGLFEITGVDSSEGYAFLKDVFTGAEYTLTDVALSSTASYSDLYLYTRIIEYQGIGFGTGLNLAFLKTDPFIQEFIRHHRENYNPHGEFFRFTQLYNRFTQDPDSVNVGINSL